MYRIVHSYDILIDLKLAMKNYAAANLTYCRAQRPRGLRRGSAATRLLGLWVRIPLEEWLSVCCECWVLSGRGLCERPITRPDKLYRV